MNFKKTGDKTRFNFVNEFCIGRQCWAPGMFQHRSPLAGGGSMNTSSPDSPCCLNRAYRGCPDGPQGERLDDCTLCDGKDPECRWCAGTGKTKTCGLPQYEKDLAAKRKAEGWKRA